MNNGKSHRKPFKVAKRIGRGSCDHRVLERKLNNREVTDNRVTLLPGFLVRGVSSNTIAKTSNQSGNTESHTTKNSTRTQCENLLNGDLQAFLQENNRHSRRSARILTKHLELQNSFNIPKNNINSNSESQKTLVRQNSKSLFAEINARYAKKIGENNKSKSFCLNLREEICVKFKDALTGCREKLRKEIEFSNTSHLGNSSLKKSEDTTLTMEDIGSEEFVKENNLFAEDEWVYKTPDKQKIIPFNIEAEQEKLKPVVLYPVNENINHVYEFNPLYNLNPSDYFNSMQLNVDTRFLNKVGVIYKTPLVGKSESNFEPLFKNANAADLTQDDAGNNTNYFKGFFDSQMDCSLNVSENKNFPNMMSTNLLQQINTFKVPKANRKLNFNDSYYNPVKNLQNIHEQTANVCDDITFLMNDNNQFEMQESQSRLKRQKTTLSEISFEKKEEDKKMFDFSNISHSSSTQKPMFDFNNLS